MFAHMFIDPIFPEEAVDKESSAVNGEYEIDISNDDWRLQLLLSLLADPKHP